MRPATNKGTLDMSSSLTSATLPARSAARPARAGRPQRLVALLDGASRSGGGNAAQSSGHQQHQQHQLAQQPPAAAAAAAAASSNGATRTPPLYQEPLSIQHPIFPESQQRATTPLPVQTQRGLPLFQPVLGDPPCPACSGTGKATCGDCRCGWASGWAICSGAQGSDAANVLMC